MTAITKHVIRMDLERGIAAPNQAGVKPGDDAGSEGRTGTSFPCRPLAERRGGGALPGMMRRP